ncbi:MAG: ATP synthase F1 subunit delta [Holophagales bacterium]|jgi:F-type H+-transporting ATPase subunit delta|nr:ATP synthase F1 subunit delta [Holophagales bacterium]
MSQLLIAQRYAKALLQIAEKQNEVSGLKNELNSIVGLVHSQPDLERLCLHPLIPPSRKAAVFDEILQAAGASQTIRRFFTVVAKAARLNLIYSLFVAFNELVDKHQGILAAEVASAQPLTEHQLRSLNESFAARTGKTMRLVTRHDPDLLGGLKVQVGSTIYDASLQGRLRMLRTRLLSA